MIAHKWWVNEEEEPFPATGKPTALVVDDPPTSMNATAEMLQRFGFVVFPAGSIGEAERVLEQLSEPLDLLVAGATLPDGHGDRLARLAREKSLSPAVLYTSGHPRRQLHARGFRHLHAPLIRKPFTDAELAERVRVLLGL